MYLSTLARAKFLWQLQSGLKLCRQSKGMIVLPFGLLALCGPLLSQSEEYQKALKNFKEERYLEAMVAIGKAVEQETDNASYYQLQAETFAALRQFTDAEKSLRRAIELQPGASNFHYQLGILLLKSDRFQEAAASLERAVELDPTSLKARFLLGNVEFQQLNRDDPALQLLTSVAKADPRYPSVHYSIGRVFFRRAQDREAVEEFKVELQINPEHAAARFLMAKALLRMRQPGEALGYFLALRGKEVGQVLLHYFLAKTYQSLGKQAEAVAALLKCNELNPDFPDAYFLLARIYQKTGQPDRTKEQMAVFEKLRERQQRSHPVDAIQ
ncbi:MAG: tetratricopeptide repeat protein [Acidobacteria bacterium]|nr:tetratricopeptide repeat protein [Acidobacteriota bacterium]